MPRSDRGVGVMSAAEFGARRAHPSAVPVSREVLDHAMDMEAIELANSTRPGVRCRVDVWHHEVSTGRRGWLIDVAVVLGLIAALALLMLGVTVLGELAGGWPA